MTILVPIFGAIILLVAGLLLHAINARAVGLSRSVFILSQTLVLSFVTWKSLGFKRLVSKKAPQQIVWSDVFSIVVIVIGILLMVDASNNWIPDNFAEEITHGKNIALYYSFYSMLISIVLILSIILYYRVGDYHSELSDDDLFQELLARTATKGAVPSPQRVSADVERREKMFAEDTDIITPDLLDITSMEIGEARVITEANRPQLEDSEREFLDKLIKDAKSLYPNSKSRQFTWD